VPEFQQGLIVFRIIMSKNRSFFVSWAIATLVFTYLVILAGSVVRATGSGMGCPDWPKCFGHFIPPTQLAQLQFEEGKHFRKGHFIIWNESLWKAKRELTAGATIDMNDWEKYIKHDYAKFNAAHTWTEYLNRLCGAILGIVSIVMLIAAFRIRREDGALLWLSALIVFLIGFEGWLGATVVESNLMPAKITTHMIVALVIVAVILATISRARRSISPVNVARVSRGTQFLLVVAIAATIAQIVMGTQVREQVDELDKLYGGIMRYEWADQLGAMFTTHKVFAWVVILLNAALVYLLARRYQAWQSVRIVSFLLVAGLAVEWLSGAILALAGLPPYIQPVHLVIATVVFGLQFQLWTVLKKNSSGQILQP